MLCERNNIEEKIKKYYEQIAEFQLKIEGLEKEIVKKNETVERVEQQDLRNTQKKQIVLERLEKLENIVTLALLTD